MNTLGPSWLSVPLLAIDGRRNPNRADLQDSAIKTERQRSAKAVVRCVYYIRPSISTTPEPRKPRLVRLVVAFATLLHRGNVTRLAVLEVIGRVGPVVHTVYCGEH